MRISSNQSRAFERVSRRAVAVFGVLVLLCAVSVADEPDRGRKLFEKSFSVSPTREFNARSCVDCHRMGGVGGAGEQQFNARSIGIEELYVPANASASQLNNFISSFYPKLVGSDGTISTVASVPHFGGTGEARLQRSRLVRQLHGSQDKAGGPATHFDLQAELGADVSYESGKFKITAKSFHRNTPALFGAGLIDAVTDEQIIRQAKLQKREKGVSGRPATLGTGGIGRFGWRANVATLEEFTRQACMNELGLQVASDPQPRSPPLSTALTSRMSNRSVSIPRTTSFTTDLSRDSLLELTAFLDSLPAPKQVLPTDPERLEVIAEGEQLFEKIGCAVCHVPDMGPAHQIYSDLLLHDMGESLRGANSADPYIYDYNEFLSPPTVVSVRTSYYGSSASLSPTSMSTRTSASSNQTARPFRSRARLIRRPYQRRPGPLHLVPLASQDFTVSRPVPGNGALTQQAVVRRVKIRRNRVRATNVSQEWRTPPLWGLRDSAPYMHDGRAATVEEAITMHDGESTSSRKRYQSLTETQQAAVLAFLDTLAAPPDAPQQSKLGAFASR